TEIHLIVVGIVRTPFDYIDLGSLAVRTAVVENMASGLHIVVGKKALGFETNGRDIEKNGRDIEYNGRDIEKNDLGIETFGRGIDVWADDGVAGDGEFELAEEEDVLKRL
ncbi:hypothetical protein Tco_0182998, partial [Tanacetum coccineum]